MKKTKKIKGLFLLFLCAGMMAAGCGKKQETQQEKEMEQLRVRGSAEVDGYFGVAYSPYNTTVTDEEIKAQVDRFLEEHAELEEITDRDVVQKGDVANIDYVGYMDGEAFDKGADTGYNLEIGSNSFISGFEEGLIGAKKGSKVEVKAVFPDPYPSNPSFAGKEAIFSVTINQISLKRIPELTDELVAANTEQTSAQAYQDYLKESIRLQKEEYAKMKKNSDVTKALLANAKFTGIEQADIDTYYANQDAYYRNVAASYESMYGLTFQSFIRSFLGCATQEEYEQMLKTLSEEKVQWELILYHVIEKEGMALSEEEYQKELASYLANYNMTEEQLFEKISEEKLKEMFLIQKAENQIYDSAVAKQ